MSRAFRAWASALHYLIMVGGGLALMALALAASPLGATAAFAVGWIAASFSEYAVHRWLMHGGRFIARVHAAHHASPDRDQIDAVSYFGPIAVAVAAWFAALALTGHAPIAHGLAAGLGFGYSWFRALHRLMHRPGVPRAIEALSRFHHLHHDSQTGNFGVTTRFWDRLFGSTHAPSGGGAPAGPP